MKRKKRDEPQMNVTVRNRRGEEIAKAIQTNTLPIKVKNGRPVQIWSEIGETWAYIADPDRLSSGQIQRLAIALSAKYNTVDGWDDALEMERVIRQRGFTVPVEDCEIVKPAPAATTISFLNSSQPRDES